MHITSVKRFDIIQREAQANTHNNLPSRASFHKYPSDPSHIVTASPTLDVSCILGRPHGVPVQNASHHGGVLRGRRAEGHPRGWPKMVCFGESDFLFRERIKCGRRVPYSRDPSSYLEVLSQWT